MACVVCVDTWQHSNRTSDPHDTERGCYGPWVQAGRGVDQAAHGHGGVRNTWYGRWQLRSVRVVQGRTSRSTQPVAACLAAVIRSGVAAASRRVVRLVAGLRRTHATADGRLGAWDATVGRCSRRGLGVQGRWRGQLLLLLLLLLGGAVLRIYVGGGGRSGRYSGARMRAGRDTDAPPSVDWCLGSIRARRAKRCVGGLRQGQYAVIPPASTAAPKPISVSWRSRELLRMADSILRTAAL